MAEYLMGIDAGTGSVRVALFDFRGQNRAYAVAEYGTTYPKNGWAEQSDYEWFEALKKAIVSRRLVSQQIISQRLPVMLQQTH